MARFVELWDGRHDVVNGKGGFFERIRQAEKMHEKELAACIGIQRVYRGCKTREMLTIWRRSCLVIQRVFRGYLGRVRFSEHEEVRQGARMMTFFHRAATVIQAVYRAHYCRTYVSSFYARRDYMRSVADRGATLRQQMQDALDEQLAWQAEQDQIKAETELEDVAGELHHLVSTSQIPGIYNTPLQVAEGTVPTVFNQPLEYQIQKATRIKMHKSGHFSQQSKRGSLKPITPRRQGGPPLSPHGAISGGGVSGALSLQASSSYDAVREASRESKKGERLSRTSSRDFASVHVAKDAYVTSFQQGVPFTGGMHGGKAKRSQGGMHGPTDSLNLSHIPSPRHIPPLGQESR